MAITKINPDDMPDAGAMGYTQVTTAQPGTMIFLSGQVGWSRDGTPVPEGLAEQAAIAVRNVERGLAAAGASAADVTSMRIYVVGLTDDNAGDAYSPLPAFFGGQAPCVTMIGVSSLASPNLLVEMEVTAVKS
ncbi:RidA family protein [Pyruvatibacter sp.]|uniref:RidA family protein n=1 Tax=Pyruvatibacter sp. TaxID=1981328 RepID=UPI0032ED30E8